MDNIKNMKNEEIIKIISDGTYEDITQALTSINDINNPLKYEISAVSGDKIPIHMLDIALLNSKDINVIKLLLEKGAIYAMPFPYIISHCKTVGIFTLLFGYPNVKNSLLKILTKIILIFAPISLVFVTSAIKNPNPEILKEVLSNKRILNVLEKEKRKGTDLKSYFKNIQTENKEEKYKILGEYGF